MECLVVDFDGYLPPAILNQEVDQFFQVFALLVLSQFLVQLLIQKSNVVFVKESFADVVFPSDPMFSGMLSRTNL